MKKKYVKPQIIFEDMTLNTTIAGCSAYQVAYCLEIEGFEGEVNFPYYNKIENSIYITADTSICEGGLGYCYDAPTKVALVNQS